MARCQARWICIAALGLALSAGACMRLGYDDTRRDELTPLDAASRDGAASPDAGGADASGDSAVADGPLPADAAADSDPGDDSAPDPDSAPPPDLLAPDLLAPDSTVDSTPPPDLPLPDLLAPDLLAPDLLAPDSTVDSTVDGGVVCPTGMAKVGSFCIDLAESTAQTWPAAVATCAARGLRLCLDSEWATACTGGYSSITGMVGNWEWVGELYSATDGRKRGAVSCSSASHHHVSTGSYGVRCCTSFPSTSGMADLSTFYIDQAQGKAQNWIEAAADCMGQKKRLCTSTEWLAACSATGKGITNITGAWEWIGELASSSNGRKRGYSSCSSSSSHSFLSGAYDTRCCLTK